MLDLAGIDTKTFKAHSVRGALTSAAASAGLMTNQIMIAADWSSESVFQRFYYRPPSTNLALLSTVTTNITLTCDLSIPKCNYLNGSDHRVIASYSGLHEECEVNISTSLPALPSGV